MPFTLEELLPDDQRIRTVQLHEAVHHVIGLMHQHGYDQLPVVDKDGKTCLGLVVTFDSILQAMRSFSTKSDQLQVRDVARTVRTYPADADLLSTLDDIQRENFALIVDESDVLTGIVTTADTTMFFREYAQDLMQIEGIEARMKDAITALYTGDNAALDAAITAVTDRAADIRKRIPAAIRGYLDKTGLKAPQNGEADALFEVEKRLALPKPGKPFDRLSFDEFIEVLLSHPNAPKVAQSSDKGELRLLLQQVRDTRNKLAHFRGELNAEERRTIQFASEWLERNLPVPRVASSPVSVVPPQPALIEPHEDDEEEPLGSYAALAVHLRSQAPAISALQMTFQEVEHVLGKELPRSAYQYRAWWANDSMKPQSSAWLEEGWRTTSISMIERRLAFARTNDRQDAYITFFAKLNARLKSEIGFPLREVSPQGANWQVLAFLSLESGESASIGATFTRRKEFRIELYLDCDDKEHNKQRFDQLLARKNEVESVIGEPLKWERLEEKRACRVAAYTQAQILVDAESPALLDWAVKKAVDFYKAFNQELPTM